MPATHTRIYPCGPAGMDSAIEELRRVGGDAEGGPSEGTLRVPTPLGRIEGRYLFDGEKLTISLTRVPPLIPVGMIWSRLDQICGPAAAEA